MKPWPYPVLALVVTTLGITTPLPQAWNCTLQAVAQQVRSYGQRGQSGQAGRTGAGGTPGPAQTVWANGSPQRLSLTGGDGQSGEDGTWGRAARCSSQPRNVAYDLQAADGGNGGNGGNGGHGGSGGDLTLYYNTPNDLALVAVDARGGRGGREGRGGDGGEGCRCRYPDWQVQTCTGTPGTASYQCQTERFFCRDGEQGRRGRDGNPGQTGATGQLWLVNRTEPLLSETPSRTQSLATLSPDPVQLSKHLWQERAGATALLAPGSFVADIYQDYQGRVEGQGQILWAAPRSPQSFADLAATFTIQSSGAIAISFSPELWVAGEHQGTATAAVYRVDHAIRAAEATQMALGNFSGQGAQWEMAVLDLGAVSDWVDTHFQVRLRTTDGGSDRRPLFSTRYEGALPADLVSRDHNRFSLALGRLPIRGSDIRPGNQAEIEITITRTLGSNQASQTLTWRGQL